jgi:hypothetical protein
MTVNTDQDRLRKPKGGSKRSRSRQRVAVRKTGSSRSRVKRNLLKLGDDLTDDCSSDNEAGLSST